jgi:hypothetical protein
MKRSDVCIFDLMNNIKANILPLIKGGEKGFVVSIALLFFFFLPRLQAQTVTVDAVSSATSSGAVTTLTWSHTTTAAQNNRLLVVTVAATSSSVLGITYNGVALTQAATKLQTVRAEIWYLLNPPSGANNVVVTHNAARELICGAVSFYNVNQSSTFGAVKNGGATSVGPAITAATTATFPTANDLIIDVVATLTQTATVVGGQTSRWNLTQSSGFKTGATSTKPGTGAAQTMSWTLGASDTWAIICVPIFNCTPPTGGTASLTSSSINTGFTAQLNLAGQSGGTTIQWQESTDNITFANIAGATANPYTTAAKSPAGTYYYRAVVVDAATLCFSYSSTTTLTVTNTIYTVTSAVSGTTVDGISLRWAITQANTLGKPADIRFNIAGGTKQTITLASVLPTITNNYTTIDGSTQPGVGYTGVSPKIIINANNVAVNGLVISGSNCKIYGLYIKGGNYGINCSGDLLTVGANGKRNVISGNASGGVYMFLAANVTGATFIGNYIGVDTLGINAETNGTTTSHHGILVHSAGTVTDVVIGGSTAGDGNVIASNTGYGIRVDPSATGAGNGPIIKGNYIGTDKNGTLDLGNGSNGISITKQLNCIIGGGTGEGNIISGNTGYGIHYDPVAASTSPHIIIKGNYIGTNASGSAALSNTSGGVFIVNSAGDRTVNFGGIAAGEGNIVSGNGGDGVTLATLGAITANVYGNKIGINAAGTAALANTGKGMLLSIGGSSVVNFGDGTAAGTNIISGNSGDGLTVNSGGSVTTSVYGNKIGTNAAGTSALANTGKGVVFNIGASSTMNLGLSSATGGNVISGNGGNAVDVSCGGALAANVYANFIGTNATGTAAISNTGHGIIFNSGSTITGTFGGNGTYDGNVISGNSGDGIQLITAAILTITVKGNRIGTNAAGTATLANTGDGVDMSISGLGSVCTFGGSAAGDGNVISGNGGHGAVLTSGSSLTVTFKGNSIGANLAGTAALGNTLDGFHLTNCAAAITLTIGSTTAADANIFSGNGGSGINLVTVAGAVNASIAGNKIGTGTTTSENIGNGGAGVETSVKDVVIGGPTTASGNYLFNNGKAGVIVTTQTGVLISHNYFMCNSQTSGNGGISLVTGGNGTKAAPAITSANTTTVVGTSAANDSIEVYLDDICGKTEGRYFRAATKANGTGNWTATGSFNGCVTAIASVASGTRNTSPFSPCVATGVLPIELIYFTAQYEEDLVNLKWITATETNNDYFTVERSTDGENFEKIAVVKGAGNSSEKLSYNFVDEHPFDGISYYRLKQTDFDGKYSHSKIVAVEQNKNAMGTVFPNPTNGSYTIQVNGNKENQAVVTMYDILGQIVYSSSVDIVDGLNLIKINPDENLPSGIYFVNVFSKYNAFKHKLIVEK